jgi:integrase
VPDATLVQIANSPFYYVQWREGGRTRRASTRTADRAQAEAVLAAFRLVHGTEAPADLTIPQALDWYWETHGKDLMRADVTDLGIRRLKTFFGATLASECRISKQQAYVDHMRANGSGDESIRRDLAVLSAALRRAEKHNRLDRAPPFITLSPAPPRERWLSRDEAATLFRALRTKRSRHVLLFARLALYTGARTMAILDLTWDRVNFSAGLIDYRVPGRRVTKKRRTLAPMGQALRRALLHQKRKARSHHVIEWGGQRVERVAKAFIDRAEGAGLEGVTPHVLRHTFASWAVRKGVPIYAVGKALGQTVASTTERYAKLAPEDVAAVMDAVRRK